MGIITLIVHEAGHRKQSFFIAFDLLILTSIVRAFGVPLNRILSDEGFHVSNGPKYTAQ